MQVSQRPPRRRRKSNNSRAQIPAVRVVIVALIAPSRPRAAVPPHYVSIHKLHELSHIVYRSLLRHLVVLLAHVPFAAAIAPRLDRA
jgi:hypothetical protein